MAGQYETVRVPASEVLHMYRPIDAGQLRGRPHVAPAIVRQALERALQSLV